MSSKLRKIVDTNKGCKHIKREGESCRLNNNCTYPDCKIETFNNKREMKKLTFHRVDGFEFLPYIAYINLPRKVISFGWLFWYWNINL